MGWVGKHITMVNVRICLIDVKSDVKYFLDINIDKICGTNIKQSKPLVAGSNPASSIVPIARVTQWSE